MGPKIFEFVLFVTALLAVAVLFRRIKRLEDQLEEADGEPETADETDILAAVGALTSEIAHLVISPLTVILGQCELARAKGEGGKRLETIEREAHRIADVVGRYREVCSEHREEVHEIDPANCARAAVRSLEELARQRGVNVHEMIEDTPLVEANPFLLTHALRTMLKAAIEAPAEGAGDVTLAVGLLPVDGDATHVAFAVADDGPGIDPEHLPRIFHPFPEGGAAIRGEGFAYAVVYAVSQAMGAGIVIDSAPGAGTRATLKVPLKKPAPFTATAPAEVTRSSKA